MEAIIANPRKNFDARDARSPSKRDSATPANLAAFFKSECSTDRAREGADFRRNGHREDQVPSPWKPNLTQMPR
jgi:hypothetical protein